MADALYLFGAGREKRLYAVPPYTRVVPLEFEDYRFEVESFAGKRCARCGATDTFMDETVLAGRQQALHLLRHRVLRDGRQLGREVDAMVSETRQPLLSVRGLTKLFGRGCPQLPRADRAGRRTPTTARPAARSSPALTSTSTSTRAKCSASSARAAPARARCCSACSRTRCRRRARRYLTHLRRRGARTSWRPPPASGACCATSSWAMVYQNPRDGLDLMVTAGGNIAERLLAVEWRNVAAMREKAARLPHAHRGAASTAWTTCRPTSAAACSSASRSRRRWPTARRWSCWTS